jgi:hypothetical protein
MEGAILVEDVLLVALAELLYKLDWTDFGFWNLD